MTKRPAVTLAPAYAAAVAHPFRAVAFGMMVPLAALLLRADQQPEPAGE